MKFSADRHLPLSLFQKKTSSIWYARFWDYKAEQWAATRSTGIETTSKQSKRKAEAVARSMLEGGIMKAVKQQASEMPLLQYFTEFWKADSAYVLECQNVKKKPLSKSYVKNNAGYVRLHISPFPAFKKITLQEIEGRHNPRLASMVCEARHERTTD